MIPSPALTYPIDLSDSTHAGTVFEIIADAETTLRLAKWADVRSVPSFRAQVTIKRLSDIRFSFEAEIEADVEQVCVVTLEPMVTHLALSVRRELQYSDMPEQNHGELTLAAGDDDAPDTIDTLHYDIAAPLLEEFLLNIDPYPRKDGAFFDAINPEDAPISPFSVLKSWKKNDER